MFALNVTNLLPPLGISLEDYCWYHELSLLFGFLLDFSACTIIKQKKTTGSHENKTRMNLWASHLKIASWIWSWVAPCMEEGSPLSCLDHVLVRHVSFIVLQIYLLHSVATSNTDWLLWDCIIQPFIQVATLFLCVYWRMHMDPLVVNSSKTYVYELYFSCIVIFLNNLYHAREWTLSKGNMLQIELSLVWWTHFKNFYCLPCRSFCGWSSVLFPCQHSYI